MVNKNQDIQNIRKEVGWAYDDLRWVTEKEAAAAQKERKELLDFLRDKVSHSFSGTKIHTGPLSRGCSICGEGFWSCMFINQWCTADCFFCPQYRNVSQVGLPRTAQGIAFSTSEDYADFLACARFQGVGISGGEPFLAFDKVLDYIKKMRARCGDSLYLWLYTNGDLAEEEKLRELAACGLDEIRFNIVPGSNRLEGVQRAIGIIATVTVEIPAVPEDYEKVKSLLAPMQRMGVAHLNLHQLMTTKANYKKFLARGYTFLHQESIPILESELTALRLLKYAVENDIGLPINYCNAFYKSEFQTKGYRERIASLAKENGEELTETGFIRRLTVRRPGDKNPALIVQASDLRALDLTQSSLVIDYFEPCLKLVPTLLEKGQASSKRAPDKTLVERELARRLELADMVEIDCYLQLILERKELNDVRRHMLKTSQVKTKDDLWRPLETIDKIMSLIKFEHIGNGFPEIG